MKSSVLKLDDFFEGVFYALMGILIFANLKNYAGVESFRDLFGGLSVFVLVSLILALKKIVDAVKGDEQVISKVGEEDGDGNDF